MPGGQPSILVTGATGLIGAHIAFDLVKSGKKIRAIKRRSSSTKLIESIFSFYSTESKFLLTQIEWHDADLLDLGALESSLEGITHVYHAAAMVSFIPKDKQRMLDINIEGTANIVNLCLEKGIEKFCHVSSIASIGRTTDGSFVDEDTWWKNDPHNSWYAISKYGAEREVWRAGEEGLNMVIVNPGFVISPGHGSSSSEAYMLLKKGLKWYSEGVTGFVDSRDVSAASILLMESDISSERFILCAGNLSFRQFFDSVLNEFGKKPTKYKSTKFLLGLGWRGEKILAKLSGRNPRLTKETAMSALEKHFFKADKIEKMTSFRYRKMEDTIREITLFYKS